MTFPGKKSKPVSWHHLTYSTANLDDDVIGKDIDIGDLILLFFELGDEFDALGFPP